MNPINQDVAGRLEEAAKLLRDQGADRYRVAAYLRAASSLRSTETPVDQLLRDHGLDGLKQLPCVGETIARAIRELVTHGRLPMLDRLRGDADPTTILASVPGIGRVLADTLHEELGLETLADLEAAAHDGRLATVAGFGPKRLAGIRDSLAHRLGRVRMSTIADDTPSVSELLDVDREYRKKVAAGELQRIAPRRFNPSRDAWLPILHTRRGNRRYTALFSNTARAHQTGNTRDWVVLYGDSGAGEHRHTVITAAYGPLRGQRVVAGREDECRQVYERDPSVVRGLMYRSEKPTEGGEIFAAHRLTTKRGRAKSLASERSDAGGGAGTSLAQSVGGDDKARSHVSRGVSDRSCDRSKTPMAVPSSARTGVVRP